MNKAILMSIQPQHAVNILKGKKMSVKVKKTVEIVYSVNEEGIYFTANNKFYFIDWQTIVDNSVEQEIKTCKSTTIKLKGNNNDEEI